MAASARSATFLRVDSSVKLAASVSYADSAAATFSSASAASVSLCASESFVFGKHVAVLNFPPTHEYDLYLALHVGLLDASLSSESPQSPSAPFAGEAMELQGSPTQVTILISERKRVLLTTTAHLKNSPKENGNPSCLRVEQPGEGRSQAP